MFLDIREGQPVKGATYRLKKNRTDRLMQVQFTMPHEFIYAGVEGVGDHQDQHLFLDYEFKRLVFCPALQSEGRWEDYLEIVEEKAAPVEKKDIWVCVSNGKMIGIDQSSGGYPWRPDAVTGVHFFPSLEKAQEYADIWTRGNDSLGYGDMKPMKFTYELERA